jgi:hypothetical protein
MELLQFLNKLNINLETSYKFMKNIELNTPLPENRNINQNNFKNSKIIKDNQNNIKTENMQNVIEKINLNLIAYLQHINEIKNKYFIKDKKDKKEKVKEKGDKLFKKILPSDILEDNFKNLFKNDILNKVKSHKLKENIKQINNIYSIDIKPNFLDLPKINNLKDIPPCFYWFEGNNTHKQGIYISICKGFIIKVPFPNLIINDNSEFKFNSIPCKYETREACSIYKKKISEIHNSDVRKCYYVHKKEAFNKIGSAYRCSLETFGNHNTLNKDLDIIDISNIKKILMYSLSDTLLTMLWYQNKFKDGDLLLTNVDIMN